MSYLLQNKVFKRPFFVLIANFSKKLIYTIDCKKKILFAGSSSQLQCVIFFFFLIVTSCADRGAAPSRELTLSYLINLGQHGLALTRESGARGDGDLWKRGSTGEIPEVANAQSVSFR